MSNHWRYSLAAGIAIAIAAPAHATDFLKAIDDVPLIAGLVENPEPVVFESELGRVVQTMAQGQVGAGEIVAFYVASLPALGWKALAGDNRLAFERENEVLSIEIREPASMRPVEVRFELIVKLASTRLAE